MVLLRALGLVSLGWYGIVLFRVASSGPYLVLVLVSGLHMLYLFSYTRYCTILCVYLYVFQGLLERELLIRAAFLGICILDYCTFEY